MLNMLFVPLKKQKKIKKKINGRKRHDLTKDALYPSNTTANIFYVTQANNRIKRNVETMTMIDDG